MQFSPHRPPFHWPKKNKKEITIHLNKGLLGIRLARLVREIKYKLN